MLDEWERKRWAGIERELSSDPFLARDVAASTKRQLRRLVFRRRFYPTGYLASALAYMVLAMGGAQMMLLFGALLVLIAVWLGIELRVKRCASHLTAAWRRLDAR